MPPGTTQLTVIRCGARSSASAFSSAEKLVAEALRRDPNDPIARSVQKQLEKAKKNVPVDKAVAKSTEKSIPAAAANSNDLKAELRLKRITNEQAPGPESLPAPVAPGAPGDEQPSGSFLDDIDARNRVISQIVQTEVENALKEARIRMASDPEGLQKVSCECFGAMRRARKSAEVLAPLRPLP